MLLAMKNIWFKSATTSRRQGGWTEPFFQDFSNLHQQGLVTKIFFVPRIVINFVLDLADKTTTYPVHCIN